jgi:hypothetical protein
MTPRFTANRAGKKETRSNETLNMNLSPHTRTNPSSL